ncbi:MAG: hypothetical protein HQ513_10300 [Rhodospirillales bacterium]|nr:hypothetical protein [Rhodospirillales bacterium]
MKVTFDIDCTPEEARTFLGLPDVQPMQKAMMVEVEQRMKDGLDTMGPDALFKTWLPAGMESFEQMQKMLFSQMGAGKEGNDK